MSDDVKTTMIWGIGIVALGLAWAAGGTYSEVLSSRERIQCISSGGEPGPDHKCTRVPPLVKDK